MKPTKLLVTLLLLNGPLFAHADILAGPITNPANGHIYYLLSQNTWTASETEARTLGGHLVTINDAAENQWVFQTFSSFGGVNRVLWIGLSDDQQSGQFVWASRQPVTYQNWSPGEPNFIGQEHYVSMYPSGLPGGRTAGAWNNYYDGSDLGALGPLHGVAEVDFCSPHRAAATATVANGFLIGATITDGGCGYTNAPLVLVQGGGGSGATATATISNGTVVGINVTSAGCCYTNAPQIVIASPPFVPSLSIRVSKVKVTQNVVLGRNYVLESSTDFANWMPVGAPFTATSESITDELDVDMTGRFFRIREVP